MRKQHPWMPEHLDIVAVAAMLSCVFMLQAWHLATVQLPATDEGVYTLVGNLLLRGYALHRDVPLWHMPLLPVLAGIGRQLLGGLYGLRLAYLIINCLAVLPLFAILRSVTGSRLAAVTGIAFYLTFNEMLDHDFRMLAIRQTANVLSIVFVWCHVCGAAFRWRRVVQAVCTVLTALLFLPALVQLGILAGGLALSASGKERTASIRAYAYMLLAGAAFAGGYLLLLEGAFQQVVVEQVQRTAYDRWWRVLRILRKPDALFAAFGSTSLLLAALLFRRWRWVYASMLGVTLLSIFLSTNYFDHYISAAGPALALGVAAGVLLLRESAQSLPVRMQEPAVWAACLCLVFWQASTNVPWLLRTWLQPGLRFHAETIDALRQQPEPVLTVQGIYVAEANMLPVLGPWQDVFRPPVSPVHDRQLYDSVFLAACTILVEPGMRTSIPADVLRAWTGSAVVVHSNPLATILRTANPQCPPLN